MNDKFWDNDINELSLSDFEKNGLQVYRNYSAAFLKQKEKIAKGEIDLVNEDIVPLEKVLESLIHLELMMIPIIICSFADNELSGMFKREIPQNIPAGKDSLFGSYGPLSGLSSQIKVAYCFDCISQDLLSDLDLLRKVRNDISHNWDLDVFKSFHIEDRMQSIFPFENLLPDSGHIKNYDFEKLSDYKRFRIRGVWIVARIFYESLYYYKVKKMLIGPIPFLYGENRPKILTEIADLAMKTTKRIVFDTM